MHSQATLFFSKKETFVHPLDMASKPTAPDPEKQSRKEIFEKSITNEIWALAQEPPRL